MGFLHDVLFEANAAQFEKDIKDAYSLGFRDGRLCPAELRPCTVLSEPALFHRWVDADHGLLIFEVTVRNDVAEKIYTDYQTRGIVPPGCTVQKLREVRALVEFPDGKVAKVPVTHVRFTDREGA